MPEQLSTTSFTFKLEGAESVALMVAHFELTEAISELFELDITFAAEEPDLSFKSIVGKSALLTIETDGLPPRYLHGMVSRIRHIEDGKRLSHYRATVVPKFWRFTHRHDNRIFQEMSVPDILKKVFGGARLEDVRFALEGSATPREYCVQFQESDFAFASRLMEEEGIFYFFEHTDEKHTLVLANAASAVEPIADPKDIHYRQSAGLIASVEAVMHFHSGEEVRPGKVSLTDYNFKKPALSLAASSEAEVDNDLEVYEYPGEYEMPGDGSSYSKVRLEEWQSHKLVVEGDSGCVRFTPGYKFTLSEHPRESENRGYLLTRVRHQGSQPLGADSGDRKFGYLNHFVGVPDDVPYRPQRKTPRPTIKGVQTAIVTGPGGEEIHTDEHGRVKVHFHWDRLGKMDDKSSCWIRVSQLWAGGGWGAMWIPRIGHEVVVDFINGDPDRPLIVGRVYHGANVPPYALPAEKTKSTIKSNSSKGGGGSNELRFEDKKGSEEIYLHGQKDWTIKIEHDKNQVIGNDETLEVGHDRTKHIKHDQSETVDNDDSTTIGHDRTKMVSHDQSETIGHDKSILVGNNHDETIGNNERQTVGANANREVAGDQSLAIGSNYTITAGSNLTQAVGGELSSAVGGDMTLSVGGSKTETVASDSSENVNGGKDITVGKDMKQTVNQSLAVSISKDFTENVGKNAKITVGDELVVSVGESSVTLKKDGSVTIVGKDITVKGSGKINVQGSSKVVVKSEGPVDVEASGAVKVKGSTIAMN